MEVVSEEPWSELGVLCVVVDNNPVEGDFFALPNAMVNMPELLDASEAQQQRENSFDKPGSTLRSVSLNNFYQVGDALPAAVASTSNGVVSYAVAFGGFLPLPSPGPDGRCVSENFVRFGEDRIGGFCVQQVADLEATCAASSSPLTLGFYLENVAVGVSPQAKASTGLSTEWLNVQVGDVFYRDLASGREVSRDSSAGLVTNAPTQEPTGQPTGQPTVSPTAAGGNSTRLLLDTSIATRWDAARQVCADVVVGQKYLIYHDERGVVNQVVVDLFLSNISLAATPANGGVSQKHEVVFINTNPGNESSVERVTSGNPGYIVGLPLQSGNLVEEPDDNKVAIEYNFDGLHMVGPLGGSGRCTEGASWWTELAGNTPS